MRPFHGLSAFPLTPADEQGRVDTAALGRLLERLCEARVDSIGLLGSTGIYAYLTRDERRRAVAAAGEAIAGRTPLIVGVGALRTDTACDLARDAAAAGADALLLAPVSYTPLTQDEAFQHFRAVAAATDLPLCIYNNPSTTHFAFGRDLVARLAEIATIQAIKMPLPADGDIAGEIAVLRRTGLAIGYSGDWGAGGALRAGADAWYSVLAGLLPAPALALTRAAQVGDIAEVARLDAGLRRVWEVFKALGSLRVMYALYGLLGFGEIEPPRPLLSLEGADRDRVVVAFAPLLAAAGD